MKKVWKKNFFMGMAAAAVMLQMGCGSSSIYDNSTAAAEAPAMNEAAAEDVYLGEFDYAEEKGVEALPRRTRLRKTTRRFFEYWLIATLRLTTRTLVGTSFITVLQKSHLSNSTTAADWFHRGCKDCLETEESFSRNSSFLNRTLKRSLKARFLCLRAGLWFQRTIRVSVIS